MLIIRNALLVVFFIPTLALSRTPDADFSRCASQALETTGSSNVVIHVKNPSKKLDEMDHNFSSKLVEYRMRLVNKASGEQIGQVTCKLDQSGNIVSAILK